MTVLFNLDTFAWKGKIHVAIGKTIMPHAIFSGEDRGLLTWSTQGTMKRHKPTNQVRSVKAEMLNIKPIMTSPIECKTNQPFKKSVALSEASPSPLTLGTHPIDIRYNITFSIT